MARGCLSTAHSRGSPCSDEYMIVFFHSGASFVTVKTLGNPFRRSAS